MRTLFSFIGNKAATQLKKGRHLKHQHKVYTTTAFKRPTTLTQKRSGTYKRVVNKAGDMNPYATIEYPISGEAASKLMEE